MRLTILFAIFPLPLLADPCADRLSALLAAPTFNGQPYAARATGEIGGMPSVTVQRFHTELHSYIVTEQPPGTPDMLHFNGGAYMADGAGGWTLAWQMDPAEMTRQAAEMRAAQATGVIRAECGTGQIDGVEVDHVAGVVKQVPPWQSELGVAYDIETATGLPKRMTYDYTMSGMPTHVQFDFTPMPDMVLPEP